MGRDIIQLFRFLPEGMTHLRKFTAMHPVIVDKAKYGVLVTLRKNVIGFTINAYVITIHKLIMDKCCKRVMVIGVFEAVQAG